MKLQAEDLRIGNWYHSVKWNKPVRLTAEDIYNLVANADGANISSYISGMFTPIPLTEDWLKRFGYLRDEIYKQYYNPGSTMPIYRRGVYWNTSATSLISKDFQYVHQLQTLYHSLTGTDLKQNK